MISLRSTFCITAKSLFPVCASQYAHRMHRAYPGVLLKLKRCQWTVGRPYLAAAVFHPLECLFADSRRRLESFGCHGIGPIMSTAFHYGCGHNSRNFAKQVPSLKPDGLRPEMTRCVVCDLFPRTAAKFGVETRLIANGPKKLARIHNRGRYLFSCRPVFWKQQGWMLSPHHHRACWVNRQDFRPLLDKRQKDLEVQAGLTAHRFQITVLPRRHAAALQSINTADVDAVALQNFDGVAADLRLVVLDITGLEQDRFTAGLRIDLSSPPGPFLEGRAREIREQLVSMDAEKPFQEDSMSADTVCEVRNTKTAASQKARTIRVFQYTGSQRKSL